MTRSRVAGDTSVPPRSTFETVGTLVPASEATSDSVGCRRGRRWTVMEAAYRHVLVAQVFVRGFLASRLDTVRSSTPPASRATKLAQISASPLAQHDSGRAAGNGGTMANLDERFTLTRRGLL